MTPIYRHPCFPPDVNGVFLDGIPWERRTPTRLECFMSREGGFEYTYGQGRGIRTYTSIKMSQAVSDIMDRVNGQLPDGWGPMDMCFLNRYDSERDHLGWHADDFIGMDHTKCIAIVSYGQPREILWRVNPLFNSVPVVSSQLLKNGSLFLMPPGMQKTHQHKIPKGSCKMIPRVSLTFRAINHG